MATVKPHWKRRKNNEIISIERGQADSKYQFMSKLAEIHTGLKSACSIGTSEG
jgi:hypothetical protein